MRFVSDLNELVLLMGSETFFFERPTSYEPYATGALGTPDFGIAAGQSRPPCPPWARASPFSPKECSTTVAGNMSPETADLSSYSDSALSKKMGRREEAI